MKKTAAKDLPSNMKTSSQNISDVGRTSQGAPRKFSDREKRFLNKSKARKIKEDKYTLKDAMATCC